MLRDCLEAIRLICNPSEKLPAHITVRGPYRGKINVSGINNRLAGHRVTIDRVGNFFDSGQNTVFFRCRSPILKEIWKKPDFPFNPHITIYDGTSPEFAGDLYSVVDQYNYNVDFEVEKLFPLSSRRGQASFGLYSDFNSELVSEIANEPVEPAMVQDMPHEWRLPIIGKICEYLSPMNKLYRSERTSHQENLKTLNINYDEG